MGHIHHESCISERRHVHHMDISYLHLCRKAVASEHSHHGIPTRDIYIMTFLQMDICIIAYLQRSICIMTYPLEDICTTRFLHLHLCKETFASQLNMCADTIMDKLCIRTPAWDICIMKIASLKGDMCIIWTFRICILVKSICIENEKFRLA